MADTAPSAKFLQARISTLTTTLIKRLENILAVAVNPDTMADSTDASLPPSLTETAVQQFQLDAEAQSLIRACEDIMMLTRNMKDLWLFGGLHTLTGDDTDDKTPGAVQEKRDMEEDARMVEQGFQRFLERYETIINNNDNETLA
ncbi:hypothetical protein PV10_02808 [Exophiala mesophila]|uniref:Mediator of RNA polymerase II transcription subunit 22 n=1 Tax=Exophiala mesophila TaxID=212818 RepID=A0A0D1Y3D9_EXOME|nr:uncharacterized protein PV10_02808 [Exophiala mesophila]KIV95121.1 hypothetical protein PV10_02808 [Exophiala mesophila]